ncbi:protein FAM13A [Neocloeon triangulifer]|uniref:protein FAM13A n=1 Tax=Neocloeon triangulifer TaxID=2078957 RepID=UPI00286F2E1D|nr:protein FAM13A [Neocloeon triangulifer]XP_059477327.1 protein FAM13A [Neocloeon triangulifer]XP_059477328.1 protein FAM13A [Neocloeon triangulifer]
MRRPGTCGGSQLSPAESALSRVRRLLSNSLPGRRTANKTMGVSLEELTARPDAQDGVPFVVLRLCSYIDSTGVGWSELCESPSNEKLIESLKCTFERTGDADLEAVATPNAAVALLKCFLQQLPEPPVTDSAALDLLNLVQENSSDCSQEVRKILSAMPEANRRLVRHVASFLRRAARRDAKKRADVEALGSAFGPCLFKYDHNPAGQKVFGAVAAQLLLDFHLIFPECSDDGLAGMHGEPPLEVCVEVPELAHQHRKRKERHESAGSSQIPQERKVIRSNSQERSSDEPSEKEKTPKAMIQDVEETGTNKNMLPLHEHNCVEAPMEEEDLEHERRRSSERFASFPRSSTPRGGNRRHHQPRKTRRGAPPSSSEGSKENERAHHHHHHHHHLHVQDDVPNASHSFLQLHPQDECESRERSPSPATPRAAPPVLDLSTLIQQIGYTEPVPSQPPRHRVPEESQVLLSPRNSVILTRRMDPNVAPSPPVEHSESLRRRDEESHESKTKQINKQIANLKKKIKVYEEQFETQNGYRPSHADKLNNKDLKKMFSELTKLRKELKQVKEEAANKTVQQSVEKTKTIVVPTLSDTLKEVQTKLEEKRFEAGRPVDLEALSREELQAEKVSLQKALLHLESLHGRPSTKGDRDLVRPLYDRYRSLKRLVIRSGGSKLRDSMSELATILEHETMDFTSPPETNLNMLPSSDLDAAENDEDNEDDDPCENLHSLSLTELIARQAEAKELKHKLRRELRDFEDEFQKSTGRRLQKEDREPKQREYAVYKQAKARLRLLDALLTKRGGTHFNRSC